MGIVEESKIDSWMRLCTARFLERVSFDEIYIREVKKFKENKNQTELFNMFKGIQNSYKKRF